MLTDIGVRITTVDVSRRERGVRQLTVDQLFLYAIALGCSVADLLIEEDGYASITPLRRLPKRRHWPKRREPAITLALTPRELREWLATGKWSRASNPHQDDQ